MISKSKTQAKTFPIESTTREVLNSYPDVENNEIVRRAKKMVWQANDMYDFVRGRSWRVRTTQG